MTLQATKNFLPEGLPAVIDPESQEIIGKGGKDQQQEKQPAGLPVKEKAGQEKKGIPQCFMRIDHGVYCQDDGKKTQKYICVNSRGFSGSYRNISFRSIKIRLVNPGLFSMIIGFRHRCMYVSSH